MKKKKGNLKKTELKKGNQHHRKKLNIDKEEKIIFPNILWKPNAS